MTPILTALLLLSTHLVQDEPAVKTRELVEKLRSDKVEEREEAARQLRLLGRTAASELEKAARGGDAEVAGRAKSILQGIGEDERYRTFKSLKGKPRIPEAMDVLEILRDAEGILKRDPESARKSARESIIGPSRLRLDEAKVLELVGEPDFRAKGLTYSKISPETTPTVPCTNLYYVCGKHESGNYFNVVFTVLKDPSIISIFIDVQSTLLPQKLALASKEIPKSKADLYEKVIAKVKNGELTPDEHGRLLLPEELRDASTRGTALVSRTKEGAWKVAFRFWEGRHENMMAFMYSSKALADSDWKKDGDGVTTDLGGLDVQRHAVLNGNWFLVGYHMD